jgi:hypothetical protein
MYIDLISISVYAKTDTNTKEIKRNQFCDKKSTIVQKAFALILTRYNIKFLIYSTNILFPASSEYIYYNIKY